MPYLFSFMLLCLFVFCCWSLVLEALRHGFRRGHFGHPWRGSVSIPRFGPKALSVILQNRLHPLDCIRICQPGSPFLFETQKQKYQTITNRRMPFPVKPKGLSLGHPGRNRFKTRVACHLPQKCYVFQKVGVFFYYYFFDFISRA